MAENLALKGKLIWFGLVWIGLVLFGSVFDIAVNWMRNGQELSI